MNGTGFFVALTCLLLMTGGFPLLFLVFFIGIGWFLWVAFKDVDSGLTESELALLKELEEEEEELNQQS